MDADRYEGLEFDAYVARYYTNKINQCRDRGIEFKLTLQQVRNMLRAKRCQLSGILLTHTMSGSKSQRPTDVTIDRLDSSRPYEAGNVCAVCFAANHAKSYFEADDGFGYKELHLISKNLKKLMPSKA